MKRILSLTIAILIIISLFSGCGTPEDENNNKVNAEFTEHLIAEKIGSFEKTGKSYTTYKSGVAYKSDNGLWGVISANGLHDTGAIYAYIQGVGDYYKVRKKELSDVNDFDDINAAMLIDNTGKVIIPEGYAAFSIYGDRYITAAKADGFTSDEKRTVASASEKTMLTFVGELNQDESVWYTGEWVVFDTVTGKFVPGAKGKHNAFVSERGRYITFSDENGETVIMNEKGELLPAKAYLFSDGSYKLENKVYDTNGNFMFEYNSDEYDISKISGDYYIAEKYEGDGYKSAIVDKSGKLLSKWFDDSISMYGELALIGDKVCNTAGESVIDGTYEQIIFDNIFGSHWLIRNEDYYTLIDKNGSVFFNGIDGGESTVWTSYFESAKEIDDTNYFYSFKDNDYTIEGHSFSPWIVETAREDSTCALIDTMTGEKLIDGYMDYDYIDKDSLAYYVYAKQENFTDVYLVISSAQIEEVTAKKNRLFDDLSTAFKNEGINVTVDKESGEILLDSSVLFGGDSAELTNDGKAFLDKFMNAYSTVTLSDEYEGFISETMIEGHTAPVSGSTYDGDMKLSQDRAKNVKDYCLSTKSKVDISAVADTFKAVGFSNSKPIYNDDGSVNMEASRRVSFRFLVNIEY